MVGDKARTMPDFPPKLRVLVEHMILSHHGQLEFGSPKTPQFPEALLLHYLDDLDSKMECMRALVEKDRQMEGCFTSYSGALERTALKINKYWDDEAPARAVKPAAESASPVGSAPPTAASSVAPPAASASVAAPASSPPAAPSQQDSLFGDKLRQALKPVSSDQDD